MTTDENSFVFDLRFLFEASKKLHGYLLHNWFTLYLGVIFDSMKRLVDEGAVGPDARPTNETDYGLLFDINALDLEKITYIVGFYFYILSGHKKSNYYLMQENDAKRILYFRGFDYAAAFQAEGGGGAALGAYSMDTAQFTVNLGSQLPQGEEMFKPLSPEDLFWETAGAAHSLFYGNYENIIHASSQPIRSFYLNANHWQEDISQLVDRMDYFVVYVSSITESVLWEIDLLKQKQRAQHATVVFDSRAIENKEMQSGMQESMTEQHPDDVLWARDAEAPALRAEELRDRLAEDFLVVTPDEFFADIDVHRGRIAAASGPVGPGAREEPLDFRFYPALDADGLKEIRDFDDSLDRVIRELVSSRSITNLPWFMNQVQLRIFTTLMLGNHDGTGRALAVYAAVTDVVRNQIATGDSVQDELTDEQRTQFGERMTQHFETADYVARKLLSYGQSHEFGDYRARAKEVYEEAFAAASDAVEDFFVEAYRRRGD